MTYEEGRKQGRRDVFELLTTEELKTLRDRIDAKLQKLDEENQQALDR